MNERLYELTLKQASREATAEEEAELVALRATPENERLFQQIHADARLAGGVMPLVNSVDATEGEFPEYARERLQTKVREVLGRPETSRAQAHAGTRVWRWALGLAGAVGLVVGLLLVQTGNDAGPSGPVVQVALLDPVGQVRGPEDTTLQSLRHAWNDNTIRQFDSSNSLRGWEGKWIQTSRPQVKVIYDKARGEIRITARAETGMIDETVKVEEDLEGALKKVKALIQARFGK
tara:strand:+ start:60 stop:764 length:705 start_codon:yes stop_codon:yes gene_type:complete